jgi:hypothetical protein
MKYQNQVEKSARDTFFYYTGATPSAVRYKNWKIYFTMEGSSGASALMGPQTYGWAQVQNIRRDPFEQAVGEEQKSVLSMGGTLASPSTAYIYNWNMLPVGQQLWLKELSSYIEFPPLQDPASHNLSQVLDQVKKMGTSEYPQVSRSNRQTANDTNYKAIEGGGKSKLSRRVIRSNDHTRHARR